MAKRHNDALTIQNGACNPSGIALSIVDACREIRDSKGGTADITGDPAVRLMVHQLAFICGIITGAEQLAKSPTWEDCAEACRPSGQEARAAGADLT